MHEQIKEHDRDIRLSQTQTSAISEHANKTWHHPLWDKVTFIDQDPHWYSRKVEEAIPVVSPIIVTHYHIFALRMTFIVFNATSLN